MICRGNHMGQSGITITLKQPVEAAARSLLTRPLVRLLLVVGMVAAIHGYSVTTGLWLDDHLHIQQLRQAPWSYRGVLEASRLDLLGPDRVLFWGGQTWSLRFYRPLAFAVMKAEYTLIGWRPAWMHVFSLLWNVGVAMLVGSLAARLLASGAAGTIASLLFAIFPNNAATVYWIACQTELMVAFFCLVSVLSYGQWSGWFDRQARRHDGGEERGARGEERQQADHGAIRWLAVALVAYLAAMFCRENAVALPGVLLLGDLLSRRPWRRRIVSWVILAGLAAIYMVLRQKALGGMSWPQRPYVMYPGDPGFGQFVWRKLLYYLSGLFICLPVVPGGTSEYAQRTFAFEIGAAVTVAVTFLSVWLTRRRLILLGLAWPAIMLLPLLPLFPSPHHLYLSGVGSIILWTAVLVGGWKWAAGRWQWLQSRGTYLAPLAMVILLVPVAGLSFISGWVYANSTAAEDEVVEEVLKDPTVHSGDQLLFINLPLAAPWITWAIENGSHGRLHDLTAAILTVADKPAIMTQSSTVTPIDRHTLLLRMDSPGWLYGGVGELFTRTSGVDWPVHQGQQVPGPIFDVTIEKVHPQTGGATELRFDFHEPLDKPGRHFYFGSPCQMAYPLHFRWTDPPVVIGPP